MLSRQFKSKAAPLASRYSSTQVSSLSPLVRTYAQVNTEQDSKPPVALFGLDGTYASALSDADACGIKYIAAVKTSTLDSTSKTLSNLSGIFKKDPKLPVILKAPTLSSTDKSQIVQELLKHTGGADKGDTVKNLLRTLAENNRLGILEGICDNFSTLMAAAKGELELTVTSASKLDSKTLQRLETAVAKSNYSQGKKLKVVPKVNPDLVGGLIVEIGDRTIDLSLSSRISKMNKLLTDAL